MCFVVLCFVLGEMVLSDILTDCLELRNPSGLVLEQIRARFNPHCGLLLGTCMILYTESTPTLNRGKLRLGRLLRMPGTREWQRGVRPRRGAAGDGGC